MKKFLVLILAIILWGCHSHKTEPQKPFPQNTQFSVNFIIPDNYTQEQINEQTSNFYDKWKHRYVKPCGNTYFIDYNGQGWNVSEGLGYGMMIMAYMAGYDNKAKEYFDGMFNFYKKHPSKINNNLMAWQQIENCEDNPNGGSDAASDGDLDIAYSLLLADKQWGSYGEINYLQEAKKIIKAIMQDEINHETYAVKLGDWSSKDDTTYFYATRSSDFILDHFRTFSLFTTNTQWDSVTNECLKITNVIQSQYSSTSGLLPDFIQAKKNNISPVNANFLESKYDGNYYYNACRVPWRLTVDYLLWGDNNTLNIIQKFNKWIISSTDEDINKIASGYYLNGTTIHSDYQDICFYGAFAVSAMLTNNQQWLNNLYKKMINDNIDDNSYFPNTLKMLYLLTISQNIWKP